MAIARLQIGKWSLFCLLLILILMILSFPFHMITILDEKQGDYFYSALVSPDDQFEIHYIHSVEHVDVRGIFRINNDFDIEPVQTIFPSYGAGMPSRVKLEDIIFDKKMMRVRHSNIKLKDLRIFISYIARQKIVFKNVQIDLCKKVGDGEIAVIEVKYRPLFFTLYIGWVKAFAF